MSVGWDHVPSGEVLGWWVCSLPPSVLLLFCFLKETEETYVPFYKKGRREGRTEEKGKEERKKIV